MHVGQNQIRGAEMRLLQCGSSPEAECADIEKKNLLRLWTATKPKLGIPMQHKMMHSVGVRKLVLK